MLSELTSSIFPRSHEPKVSITEVLKLPASLFIPLLIVKVPLDHVLWYIYVLPSLSTQLNSPAAKAGS